MAAPATPLTPFPGLNAIPSLGGTGTAPRPRGPAGPNPPPGLGRTGGRGPLAPIGPDVKWSWACRGLDPSGVRSDPERGADAPRPGDLAIVRIASLGYHSTVVTADNRKLRIYEGDRIVGVFGHRYATDAYEARVDGLEELSLLTAGGMIGTILSRHREMARATSVVFEGYLRDAHGDRLNLKELRFRPTDGRPSPGPLLVVVGTGMNAGKTTVASRLIHALSTRGLHVAATKLTGSVSNRDQDEMRAAAAEVVVDFSDYGFPSTYLASADELRHLWRTMLSDVAAAHPDVTVMEIADGILQRETEMILTDPGFRDHVSGLLLAADSALGALAAVDRLVGWGYRPEAVSGALTSAPLYVREFTAHSPIPVASSADDGRELAAAVLPALQAAARSGARVDGTAPIAAPSA